MYIRITYELRTYVTHDAIAIYVLNTTLVCPIQCYQCGHVILVPLQPHCVRNGDAALHGAQPLPQVHCYHQVLAKGSQVWYAHARRAVVCACLYNVG